MRNILSLHTSTTFIFVFVSSDCDVYLGTFVCKQGHIEVKVLLLKS